MEQISVRDLIISESLLLCIFPFFFLYFCLILFDLRNNWLNLSVFFPLYRFRFCSIFMTTIS